MTTAEDRMETATILRLTRRALGYSQADFARVLAYGSGNTVSRWERGAFTPPGWTIAAIKRFLREPAQMRRLSEQPEVVQRLRDTGWL